ncbi:hypothetical protein ACTFIW_002859 [Dictyostelium discoideum]
MINNKRKEIDNINEHHKKDNDHDDSDEGILYSSTSTSPSIQLSSTIQFDENIDKWIQTIIESENCTALDQFIKFFKIDSEVIKKVIEIHIKPSFFCNSTYDKFQIYNYLKSINSLPTSHTLLLTSEDLQIFLSFDNKFKKLIKSYERLIGSTNLKEQQEEQKNLKMHPNNKKYYEKLNQITLELNEIQTSQFTNDQLNSTIHNLLNHTNTSTLITTKSTENNNNNNNISLKDIIKKYYKSICLFFNCTTQLNDIVF